MPKFEVRFTSAVEFAVTVDAEDEEDASYDAWELANAYAETVLGDGRDVRAAVSLDGIGADAVEEV